MGLPLIGVLSNSFSISSERDGGTEVTIRLPMGASATINRSPLRQA